MCLIGSEIFAEPPLLRPLGRAVLLKSIATPAVASHLTRSCGKGLTVRPSIWQANVRAYGRVVQHTSFEISAQMLVFCAHFEPCGFILKLKFEFNSNIRTHARN